MGVQETVLLGLTHGSQLASAPQVVVLYCLRWRPAELVSGARKVIEAPASP